MPITETTTKVLIVGAGPSGLMMAAQLLRYGIQPVIIDSKEGPTDHSKALAVQARSMEIYRQLGVVDKALAEGKEAKGVVFNQDGKAAASLTLQSIGKDETLYPYVFMYPQSKNERLLLNYLTQHACPVYWNSTLVSFTQNAGNVSAVIQQGDNQHTLTCDYLIGADGARSTVRKELQIAFKGDTYKQSFYLIDADTDISEQYPDYVNLYLNRKGFAAFFPITGSEMRIVGNLPAHLEDKEDIEYQEIVPFLREVMDSAIGKMDCHWFATYKLHHRMAENFRQQHCFLIGDAAHIHSPIGGQGMNTGLQDAYNLAWKLAGVLNGNIKPAILDTYASERMPVARELLRTTDAMFKMVISRNWLIDVFKKLVLARILKLLWKSERIRQEFFRRASQIGINYRHSALNLHLSNGSKIKAGDRLPYIPIYDEKREADTDLHEWCSKPGFTLIALGRFEEMFLFTAARWMSQQYNGVLNFYYLPPSGKNLKVFEAFEADPHGQKAIIVRPDMYIGYMNDVVDLAIIDNYLRNVAGIKPPLNLPR
jgi:2-polyprenyl-6-methoxyphenol hydroxylase-like FAD-dependent oxidoreductase